MNVGLVKEAGNVLIVMELDGMIMGVKQSPAGDVAEQVSVLPVMEEISIFIVMSAAVTVMSLVSDVTVQESVIHAADMEMSGAKLAVVREYVANVRGTEK